VALTFEHHSYAKKPYDISYLFGNTVTDLVYQFIIIITYFKTKSLLAVCPYVRLDLYNYPTDYDAVFNVILERFIMYITYVLSYRNTLVSAWHLDESLVAYGNI
jgi:hypothetical protein